MDPALFYTLIEHLGLPVGLLVALFVALALAAWRIQRALWEFLKPLIVKAFEKHITLMDAVIEKAHKVDVIDGKIDKCLDGHAVTHEKLDQILQSPPATAK